MSIKTSVLGLPTVCKRGKKNRSKLTKRNVLSSVLPCKKESSYLQKNSTSKLANCCSTPEPHSTLSWTVLCSCQLKWRFPLSPQREGVGKKNHTKLSRALQGTTIFYIPATRNKMGDKGKRQKERQMNTERRNPSPERDFPAAAAGTMLSMKPVSKGEDGKWNEEGSRKGGGGGARGGGFGHWMGKGRGVRGRGTRVEGAGEEVKWVTWRSKVDAGVCCGRGRTVRERGLLWQETLEGTEVRGELERMLRGGSLGLVWGAAGSGEGRWRRGWLG